MNDRDPSIAMPATDFALAAYLGKIAPELITGRKTLYHGTSKKRADSILQHGLHPEGRVGITSGMDNKPPPLAYLSPNKFMARFYANQTDDIENVIGKHPPMEAADRVKEYAASRERDWIGKDDRGRALKARVPTWQYDTVRNPELGDDSLPKFVKRLLANHDMAGKQGIPAPAAKEGRSLLKWLIGPSTYAQLSSDFVTPQTVSAEHFVDSPHYRGLSGGELLKYIKAKPLRFLAGLGSAAAVPALAAHGGKQVLDHFKDGE